MAALTPAGETCREDGFVWAWAGHGLEEESGDLHVVAAYRGGALVALIDGLGHGEEAAAASRAAAHVLRAHAGLPVLDLVEQCHDALRRTRGAALSVASLDLTVRALTWTGVGNVDAVVLRDREGECGDLADAALLPRGGVVGYKLPPLRAGTVRVGHGDLLVMHTDGIRAGCTSGIDRDSEPAELAGAIMAHHARRDDDARVVVARFRGSVW